jgi:hypothetical protein
MVEGVVVTDKKAKIGKRKNRETSKSKERWSRDRKQVVEVRGILPVCVVVIWNTTRWNDPTTQSTHPHIHIKVAAMAKIVIDLTSLPTKGRGWDDPPTAPTKRIQSLSISAAPQDPRPPADQRLPRIASDSFSHRRHHKIYDYRHTNRLPRTAVGCSLASCLEPGEGIHGLVSHFSAY